MATNFIWHNNLLFISRRTFEPVFWGFANGFCVVFGMQHLVSEIWMSGLFVCLFFSILLSSLADSFTNELEKSFVICHQRKQM